MRRHKEKEELTVGSRFGDRTIHTGPEVLEAYLWSQIEAEIELAPEAKEEIELMGGDPSLRPSARDRIVKEQDQIVWLGKDDGSFDEELT